MKQDFGVCHGGDDVYGKIAGAHRTAPGNQNHIAFAQGQSAFCKKGFIVIVHNSVDKRCCTQLLNQTQ